MEVNANLKDSTRYTWKVGLYQGFVGVILFSCGHPYNYHGIADLSEITILISSYVGGPISAVITTVMNLLFRLAFESSIETMISVTVVISLNLIISIISVRFIKHYWMQWVVSVTCSNLVFLLSYLFLDYFPLGTVALQFIIVYQASGLFIAAKLYYMSKSQQLKQKLDVLQSDLLEILHLQPGFIYKLTKEQGKIVYKIAGGTLLNEIGISYEDIVGKSIDELTVFSSELNDFMQSQKEKAWRGEYVSFELNFAEHTLLATLKPIFSENRVSSVIGTVTDITERKLSERQLVESEELYRTLVDSSQDFIIRMDVEGHITAVNKKVLEVTSKRSEYLIGEHITTLFTPGKHIETWQYHFDQVVSGRTMESFEYNIKCDNQEFDFYVTLSPFYDMNQIVVGVMCTAHDIKNLKKSRAAVEANEAKSVFVARMSHEIRTPLSAIIGLTALLMRQEMSPVQKDYLDKILSSSHVLLGIINDVLDISKIEAGKIELQKAQFNIHHLMQELSDILTVLVGDKQLKFIIDTSADIPETLYGDSMRIGQILINIINNAIKFTDCGHIYVKVELVSVEDDLFHIEFSVEDTGIGITSEQMSQLFEPFTQVGYDSKNKYSGTGLGLSICKYFVEMMGGTIHVSSRPGHGSKFSFILPFDQVSLHDQMSWEDRIDYSQMNILVIESNEAVRSGICSMLESMNFRVTACEHDKYLDLSSMNVEVILTDISTDDKYSLDDWLLLKRRTSALVHHVAILTAKVHEEIRKLPDDLQPDAVILMPISRIGLMRTMRSLVWNEVKQPAMLQRTQVNALRDRHMNILLAEDNEICQLVITEMLRSYGFQVTVANHGIEVLHLLNQGRWDLLLMDIQMPELDGVETTKIIREDHRFDQLQIFALTANMVCEDHEMYHSIGIDGVLTKPLDINQLISLINRQDAANDHRLFTVSEHREPVKGPITGIDVQATLRRINGKYHIMIHMFHVFLRDYSHFASRMKDSLSRNDLICFRKMLHTLKGAAANISAVGLLDAAIKLETVLEQGGDMDAGMELLDRELQIIIVSLQHYVNNGYDSNNIYGNDGERV
ncbi:ATP-binding protein [Paenibacillus marinisediminis]